MFILNTIPKKMEENEKQTNKRTARTKTITKEKCSIEVGCKMLCSEKLPLWKNL